MVRYWSTFFHVVSIFRHVFVIDSSVGIYVITMDGYINIVGVTSFMKYISRFAMPLVTGKIAEDVNVGIGTDVQRWPQQFSPISINIVFF